MSRYAERYSKFILPDAARCLGKELHPVTLGHCFLMWRMGSPLAKGGALGTGNLLVALYVLTRPWEAAAAGLNKKRFKFLLRAWGFQMRLFGKARAHRQVKGVLEDWINFWWDEPEMWNEATPEGDSCNAPYLQSLKVRLEHHLHRSERDALNTPVAIALWDLAAYAEEQGRAQLVSEEDAEAIDKALGVTHG